jgi:hypothetical protein
MADKTVRDAPMKQIDNGRSDLDNLIMLDRSAI